jgi:hypothetical protein
MLGLRRAGGERLSGGGTHSRFTYLLQLELSAASNIGIRIECGHDAASNGCGIHVAGCTAFKGMCAVVWLKLSRGPGRKTSNELKNLGVPRWNGGAHTMKYEARATAGAQVQWSAQWSERSLNTEILGSGDPFKSFIRSR